jgi:DNA mismatch repair protein MutS
MEMVYLMNHSGDKECILTGRPQISPPLSFNHHQSMELDKTTYSDLSIFSHEEEYSVFHKLNFTRTIGGKAWLKKFFSEPFSDIKSIYATHNILKLIIEKEAEWPDDITNGTVMMMEKFYESNIDPIPENPHLLSAASYRFFHNPDFSLLKFSVVHFISFIRGMRKMIALFEDAATPGLLNTWILRAKDLLNFRIIDVMEAMDPKKPLPPATILRCAHFLLYRFKPDAKELIDIYSRLDAYYSMSMAVKQYDLCFPEIINDEQPCIEGNGLYHILLSEPVAYDVQLNRDSNFLFLTGANMAGKSTFIKATGTAVFLAHIGMGVPARSLRLTLFNGLLSNIQVEDNIIRGESYFFNEVQRIKNTILKINDGRKWLVLIDELFKGTNVQDAMKCSTTVIEGLIRISNSLFILSTHLYEIGEGLKQHKNISFRFFETAVNNDQLEFSYQMKEGISNDRLGYLILKREKVVELLAAL